jgi:iron complex outermembrane recepter protein
MRSSRFLIATALVMAYPLIAQQSFADESTRYELQIERQSLSTALQEFATQSGVQIIFFSKVTDGYQAPALKGSYTAAGALQLLLNQSNLTFRELNPRTIEVQPKAAVNEPGKDVGADLASPDTERSELEEIVVTAQKRKERLIDTPQSVSVLSSDHLTRLGATQFRDFANTVPGLSFSTAGPGYTQISLRGVTAGIDLSPTVGIYVDEVPFGSTSAFAQGVKATLDMGLFDVERIEVLRGPQGTLYGASTMGGLIKYVSKQPNAQDFGVDVQTGISGTEEGSVNFNGSIAVNVPLVADRAAVRASAFHSRDGGYIDNPTLSRDDVNRADVSGGRIDVSLTPTDALSIRIGGFLQNISREGEATVNYALNGAPENGSLDQDRWLPEPYDQRFRLVSGTITYDFGGAALTSISSYQTSEVEFVYDLSRLYTQFFPTYSTVGLREEDSTNKFTQEVRVASAGARTLEWLIGGFYTHEDSDGAQAFVLRALNGQPAPNDLFAFTAPTRFEEYAAFGDLTYHLTERLDVSGGIRYAENRQSFTQFGSGALIGSTPTVRSSEDVSTYLANARYRFGDRATGYVRFATGYRPGGPNFVLDDPITGLPVGPETFEADRLNSYEAGFKAELAERRVQLEVAGYFIDWNNIQIVGTRGGFSGKTNAPGGATIRGAEVALTVRPVDSFAVTGAFAYQDTQMSEADPDLGAVKGERLPNVPRFTGTVNADYDFAGAALRPTVGATLRHVSERMSTFNNNVFYPQYRLPEYTTVDLRAGLTFGAVDTQLYVHNVFDERGQLSAFNWWGFAQPAILQPRTIGISATAHF